MTYILSLLNSQSPSETLNRMPASMLCYHINNTTEVQIVRVLSDSLCHFERIVFPKERVLFEALPESFLEIYSPFPDSSRITRLECKLFQVSER